jgi:hypothetical protein
MCVMLAPHLAGCALHGRHSLRNEAPLRLDALLHSSTPNHQQVTGCEKDSDKAWFTGFPVDQY